MKVIKKIHFLVLLVLSSVSFAQSNDTVSIIGVGDIMLGTNFPNASYLPPNNGKHLMKAVHHILTNADVTFGNLEGTILNKGSTVKNCQKCYSFRMPEKLAQNLVTAGFDVLSLANNHIHDFGQKGINNTLKVLNKKGIYAAGVVNQPSVTFTKNGVTYGLAAFAPNKGTIQITQIAGAKKIVRQLAKTSDIVIVSFHGGAEGIANQHVPRKTEYYYKENRGNVYRFAHAVINAGADIVFGHGPHVTRAVEVYKNRFIAYSLGNFCTYGRFNLKGAKGFAPIIKVKVKKDGHFVSARIYPIKQEGRGIVKIDPNKKAIKKIRYLTKKDFPKLRITINKNGLIRKF